MYIAEPWMRKANEEAKAQGKVASLHPYAEELDRERREFIRTASIAIAAVPDRSESDLSSSDEYGQKHVLTACFHFTPSEAVDRAKELWEEMIKQGC